MAMPEQEVTNNPDGRRSEGGKTLAFELAGITYGVPITEVREIIGMVDVIPIPRTPDFIRGVMNLRGMIIPVLDLRTILWLDRPEDVPETRIVVVENGLRSTGLIVDRVLEVLDIEAGQVAEPPDFGSTVDTGFVHGMGHTAGGVVTLLDLKRVLDAEQRQAVRAAMETQGA